MRTYVRCAALAITLGAIVAPGGTTAAVFVNEIHYDDSTASGDVGERIEVVATAGENLTEYRIVLYNGSGGASYDDDPVPIGDVRTCGSQVRLGVVTYPLNGVQNGAPDGMALVGPGNTVIQFLSYEGSFTATGGPANGLTSTDIGVAESNATLPGTSLQLAGSGAAYADFAWQASRTDNFGECNTGQTFVGGADVPPTVTSSVPAPAATGVAVNANLTVNFSEPVDVLAPWFTISCTSGPRTAVVSGGPTSYTLDPDSDFAFSESCTLTVLASGVRDRDGTPDAMAVDYVAAFTTTADLAPTVLSTIPADKATQVAPNTNITINFSEPVSVVDPLANATCTTSGPLTLVRSGGPGSWTLDPSVDLAFDETCTVTVRAAAVTDLDGTATAMVADYVFDFTVRAEAGNYYAGVNASSCQALRASLHALIDDHTVLAYTTPPPGFQPTTNTWTMLEAADQDPGNPARILDVYRNRSYTKVAARASGTCTSGSDCYNREHTWPNSLGFGSNTGDLGLPNAPYTDGHMLYLSAVDWNADRGNKPYATCPPPGCGARGTDAQPAPFDGSGGTCDHALGNCNWVQTPDGNTGSFEPWRKRKGDMARAMFYMAVRYEGGTATGGNTSGQSEPDLELTNTRAQIGSAQLGIWYMGLLSDLLAWHAADPPTEHDVLRNDVIQTYQGNRNPFVDRPEWVAIAFQNPCLGAPERIFADGFETPPP